MRAFTTIGLALMATSCNRYDLFRIAGYEQATFTNRADVLFVIDDSDSMQDVSSDLAVNFSSFVRTLGQDVQTREFDDLSDAVDNYVDFVQNRGLFVDFQFGIISTDAEAGRGALLGPLVSRSDANIEDKFVKTLACEAVCFRDGDLPPNDPDFDCPGPVGNELSSNYLDCTCEGNWVGNCGGAREEALESVFLAMCRAVPNPPEACFVDVKDEESGNLETALLTRAERETNAGLLRDDSNFLVVVVTDEGDSSRRQFRENIPDDYVRLFDQFGRRITWVLIGQDLRDDGTVRCPSAASDWAVQRYHFLAKTTGGEIINLLDSDCETRPFDQALQSLSDLLQNFLTSFPLQSLPVPGTIVVQVDGENVEEGEITGQDEFGLPVYSSGWSYRASDNSIEFHGDAIPPYESVVEVFYQPVDGIPIDLPF